MTTPPKRKSFSAPSRLDPGHRSPFRKGYSGNPKGRPKGRTNRVTLRRAADIAASGLTPLEFMLQVLRSPKKYSTRDRQWAAQQAAPYCHRKMPIAIEGGDVPIKLLDLTKLHGMSDADLERLASNLDGVLATLGMVVGSSGAAGDAE